jgi:hypothetical protein
MPEEDTDNYYKEDMPAKVAGRYALIKPVIEMPQTGQCPEQQD